MRYIPAGGRRRHHTTQDPSICNVSEQASKVRRMCHVVSLTISQVLESGSHSEPLGCTAHTIIRKKPSSEVQEEAATIREDRKTSSTRSFPKMSSCVRSLLSKTMMLSLRCRHRHLWEAVNRNEQYFSCRVIFFHQVNQVTTRVKSEPMLLAVAESRSFTGPSDDFTNMFFCTLSDKHRNHTSLHLSPQWMNTNHVSSCQQKTDKACTSALQRAH